MQELSQRFYPVAVHEYVHLLVQRSGLNPPLWWNEGTAELFSSLKPVGEKVRVGDILAERYLVLRQERWLDLPTLMAVDHDSEIYNEKDKKGVFYAQTWALMHMLNLSDKYRPALSKLNSRLESGASPEELFRESYGKTLAEVEKDLSAYVRQSYFNAALFDIKLEKSAETPEVVPATELEVSLALANALTGLRRDDEARKMLTALRETHPKQWETEQLLGYMDLHSGKFEGARESLARAIEYGTKDAKAHFDYAQLLLQTDPRHSGAIPALEKAVELAPANADATLLLAELYVMDGRHVQAVRRIASLKNVDKKQSFRVFRTLARAYVATGQLEDAAQAAEKAQLNADKPEEKEEAERLLSFVASSKRALSVRTDPGPPPAAAVETEREQPEGPSPDARPRTEERTARTQPQRTEGNRPKVAIIDKSRTAYIVETQRHMQIRGVLKTLDCLDKQQARVRLDVQGRAVNLLIRDPNLVTIQGTPGKKVDFSCGRQKDTPVAIRFFPLDDEKLGTSGLVVAIEFQ
jgi:tetratricopeptide (TPR) repeat protein